MTRWRAVMLLLLGSLLWSACASSAAPRAADSTQVAASPAQSTLEVAIYAEPSALTEKPLSSGAGTNFYTTLRMFNADLAIIDQQGQPQPYLAAALPQLNTDSWQVAADGQMDTTFKLKPNLTWHDGAPLTADDFVFAWQVYTTQSVGIANGSPQNRMGEATALDPDTLLIHWKQPYFNAGTLAANDFPPLPRHLLGAAFEDDPASLATNPFWTREYVGAGPFRLTHWEPGAFIAAEAFPGHSLGQPKIANVRLTFMGDANTVLAALVSGQVQLAVDTALKFDQGLVLEDQWVAQELGNVLVSTGGFHGAFFQLRPAYTSPRATLDVRVRRALASTLKRQDVNDALFAGRGAMSETPYIPPATTYFGQIDAAVHKYPYSVNTAEQLMADAGFSKGADGVFASPGEGPLVIEVQTLTATDRQKEMDILSADWREAGFQFHESTLAPSQAGNNEVRSTFPGVFTNTTGSGELNLAALTTKGMGTAENRWIGPNRSGWSNDEFDRFAGLYANSVEPSERIQNIAQMARVMTDDLPVIPISFDQNVDAFASAVQGPHAVASEALMAWNIYLWELK